MVRHMYFNCGGKSIFLTEDPVTGHVLEWNCDDQPWLNERYHQMFIGKVIIVFFALSLEPAPDWCQGQRLGIIRYGEGSVSKCKLRSETKLIKGWALYTVYTVTPEIRCTGKSCLRSQCHGRYTVRVQYSFPRYMLSVVFIIIFCRL